MRYSGDDAQFSATISYGSDSNRWIAETSTERSAMFDALTQHFGPECQNHDDNCPNCRRWKAFHELFANPYED